MGNEMDGLWFLFFSFQISPLYIAEGEILPICLILKRYRYRLSYSNIDIDSYLFYSILRKSRLVQYLPKFRVMIRQRQFLERDG